MLSTQVNCDDKTANWKCCSEDRYCIAMNMKKEESRMACSCPISSSHIWILGE